MARKSNNGFPADFTSVALQQAYRSMSTATYCRYCGADIKHPTSMSTKHADNRWYNDWEIENNAHEKCYNNHYRGRR